MLVLKPCVSGVRLDTLAFSLDGQTIAAPAGHRGVMLWSAFANGAKAELVALPNSGASRLAFAPGGKYLLAGNDELHAIDLGTRAATRYPLKRWGTLGFAPSPDGSRVVVGETLEGRSGTRFTLRRVPPDVSLPEWASTSECHLHTSPRFLDGERFVTFEWWPGKGVCMTVRSAETGEILSQRTGIPDSPDNFVLSPDGGLLACQVRGFVHVQPVDEPFHRTPEIRNDTKKHFTGIAYHPSGRYIAATSNDKTVKLFDATTWELARTFTWNAGRMRSIAFSPDGTLAAAGGDTGKVVVWDVDV